MSSRPIRTFSIGFEEQAYNEAHHARVVATHLGTDHTELTVTARDAQDVVPLLPSMLDEPFGDSSAIPTYLVARLARQHVTVSLSGDGGDELFAGYTRYFRTARAYEVTSRLPRTIALLALDAADRFFRATSTLAARLPFTPVTIPRTLGFTARRIELVQRITASTSLAEAYSCLLSHGHSLSPLLNVSPPRTVLPSGLAHVGFDALHELMAIDALSFLPDDILLKVDRTSMAVSLETRVPLLDHRVVELAWRLPLHMKVRSGLGKWILRRVLTSHIPQSVFDRPKMGFGAPVGEWVRGSLRDWAEGLLSESSLRYVGLLPGKAARATWIRHVNGDVGLQEPVWRMLLLQAWHLNHMRL